MIIWIHGPSGAGKSIVGQRLADHLDLPFIDLDKRIEEIHGRSIVDIFCEVSESGFRAMEWNALVGLCESGSGGMVVALGGGAVTEAAVRRLCRSTGLRVFLDVSESSALPRLEESDESRPLLFEEDPAAAWRRLYRRRLPWYRDADIRIDGDANLPDVVDSTVSGVRRLMNPVWQAELVCDGHSRCAIDGFQSPFVAMRELRARLGHSRHAFVTDTGVLQTHGELILPDAAHAEALLLTLDQGESSKDLASIGEFVAVLVARTLARDGIIVGAGGGVVTDVAGFLASIYMRGIRCMYLPTTLIGQVDAAIGGKTAINAAGIRNLLGTVRQPERIFIATGFLHSLPSRELRAGFVEVMKMGIANSEPLGEIASLARDAVIDGEIPESIDTIVEMAVRTKLRVVSRDVDDRAERMSLNLGHTFSHAVEATVPGVISHGEGVALGIIAAAELAYSLGVVSMKRREWLREYLLPFTPAELPDLSIAAVLSSMTSDKKSHAGVRRLVLPREGTGYDVVDISNLDEIAAALSSALEAAKFFHAQHS